MVGSARSTTGADRWSLRSQHPCSNCCGGHSLLWQLATVQQDDIPNVARRRRSNARQAGWVRWAGWGNLPERKAPLGHGLVTALFPRGCGCRSSSPWRGAQAELGRETGLELPASVCSQFSPWRLIPCCHAAQDPPPPIEMIESRNDPKSTGDRTGRVRDSDQFPSPGATTSRPVHSGGARPTAPHSHSSLASTQERCSADDGVTC